MKNRRRLTRSLISLMGAVSMAAGPEVVQAQPVVDPIVFKSETADLDGDRRPESIRVAFYRTRELAYDRAVLEVNGTMLVARGEALSPAIHVVDVDSTDAFLELIISERGPSDDPATHIFRFVPGALTELGALPGFFQEDLTIDGSGRIRTICRGSVLQTWFYPCEFALGPLRNRFDKVPEQWRPMNTPVTLISDLSVQLSPDNPQSSGILHAGEHATILRSDDQSWCYIESETGTKGYFGLINGLTVASSGISVWAVFGGLSFAD